MNTKKIIGKIHGSRTLGAIFHSLESCLRKELKDCDSVLDIGCGPSSPLQFCENVKYSVGVEPFKPYLEKSRRKKIHSEYIGKKIEALNFPDKSFDAVMMIEVLEHLPKSVGSKCLKKAENWARKKIIVSTPRGYWHQVQLDENPLQEHISGWSIKDFKERGYVIRGLSGLKILRKESEDSSMGRDLLSPIRFRPKFFWFVILSWSQIFTYFFPQFAFELFCVKKINKD